MCSTGFPEALVFKGLIANQNIFPEKNRVITTMLFSSQQNITKVAQVSHLHPIYLLNTAQVCRHLVLGQLCRHQQLTPYTALPSIPPSSSQPWLGSNLLLHIGSPGKGTHEHQQGKSPCRPQRSTTGLAGDEVQRCPAHHSCSAAPPQGPSSAGTSQVQEAWLLHACSQGRRGDMTSDRGDRCQATCNLLIKQAGRHFFLKAGAGGSKKSGKIHQSKEEHEALNPNGLPSPWRALTAPRFSRLGLGLQGSADGLCQRTPDLSLLCLPALTAKEGEETSSSPLLALALDAACSVTQCLATQPSLLGVQPLVCEHWG